MRHRPRVTRQNSRELATRRRLCAALGAGLSIGVIAASAGFNGFDLFAQSEKPGEAARFEVERVSGRVVFLGEAMQRRHGVKSVDEALDRSLSLETDDGRLLPLVEDIRGRGFRRDERLRKMHVELLMRHYTGAPTRQVIGVFELAKSDKFEIDYWCEICAIAMYELKECECCQGPIELRRRRVARP